jgi:hypothetical protein
MSGGDVVQGGPGRFSLASSAVAGFAHAEVLEVVDLALDLGALAQQGLGRSVLGGVGGGDAPVCGGPR